MQNSVERVRIVDSNGNPAQIHKIVPKFNEEQMIKQKEAIEKARYSDNNIEINRFNQNYNNNIQPENGFIPINTQIDDQNIIMTRNMYPDDIFDDRITNYNYIENKEIKENKIITDNSEKNISKTNNNIVSSNKNNNSNTKNIINSNKNKEEKKYVLNSGRRNNQNATNSLSSKKNNKVIAESEVISGNLTEKNTNISSQNKNQTAQANSAKSNRTKTTNPPSSNAIKTTKTLDKGYYIQIGIYGKKDNADKSYNKYKSINRGVIQEYSVSNSTKYKVLLGPYNNRELAEKDLEKVIKTGHYDVYITEKK